MFSTLYLKCSKIVIVSRRVVYLNDEGPMWLYSCLCDKSKKELIDSLPDVITDVVEGIITFSIFNLNYFHFYIMTN